MSRLIVHKPVDDTPLNFAPMGQKSTVKVVSKKSTKAVPKKIKKVSKPNRFAKKAASALANIG